MNILVCTPYGPDPHRIHPLTQQSIDALDHASVGINSPDGKRMNRLDDLCYKHNQARKLTLNGGYDALLCVDADMVIPADAMEKLTSVDADVVYGLYVSRQTPTRWLCFIDKAMTATYTGNDVGVVESYGAGLGCTLIYRHVLEELEFRTDGRTASDWWFAVDATNYGYRQMHHLGVRCGHIDESRMLWPDASAKSRCRVETL